MKKTIYSSLALGAVLALASCASDEPLGNNQNDGSLSFTVSLPGQNTRFAEGTTVDRLYYSVFDTPKATLCSRTMRSGRQAA